jgi:hypothetical protein
VAFCDAPAVQTLWGRGHASTGNNRSPAFVLPLLVDAFLAVVVSADREGPGTEHEDMNSSTSYIPVVDSKRDSTSLLHTDFFDDLRGKVLPKT